MNSKFLTTGLINECFAMIAPMLTERFITSVPGRVGACIVVLDPSPFLEEPSSHPPVLWSGTLGESDITKWKYPYNVFAKAKAELAWRTKMSNHIAMAAVPHLLTGEDFKFAGGVYLNGICVGTSGLAKWEHDLFVSNMFAGMIDARVVEAANAKLAEKILFLRDATPVAEPAK